MNRTHAKKADFHLVIPDSSQQWAAARQLIEEYAASLPIDLGFQDFGQEIKNLEEEYGPPDGAFLLAELDSTIVGCIGLRKFSVDVCEMKRLYVVPASRGLGIGRALVETIIDRARQIGYERMVLDTLSSMLEAQSLYRSVGMSPTQPYRHNPDRGAGFFELML